MKKLLGLTIAFGLSTTPTIAQLYECGGDAACQAKRAMVSRSTYDKRINGCLAVQGYTREQWRAHSVPDPAASKIKACVSR